VIRIAKTEMPLNAAEVWQYARHNNRRWLYAEGSGITTTVLAGTEALANGYSGSLVLTGVGIGVFVAAEAARQFDKRFFKAMKNSYERREQE
jgi:hypothetical protein